MGIEIDQLPARLQRLDDSAYRDFAAVFGPRLRRYFMKLGSCPADAEALANTCINDISLKADRFQNHGPGHFERWVFVVARNAWIDEWRRRVGVLLPEVTDGDFAMEEEGEDASQPARDAAVSAALANLPEADRSIMSLRYFEGVDSFAEVGRRMGLSEAAVRVRHHRALKKLSLRLAAYQPRDRAAVAGEEVSDNG
jgi:RNA polymerase sigma-70 factor (ECF subfamily)